MDFIATILRFTSFLLCIIVVLIACSQERTKIPVIGEHRETIGVTDTLEKTISSLQTGSFFDTITTDKDMTVTFKELQLCASPNYEVFVNRYNIQFDSFDLEASDEFSIYTPSAKIDQTATTPSYMFSEWYLEELDQSSYLGVKP